MKINVQKYRPLISIVIFLLLAVATLQTLEVKIGTLAPENTSWGKALKTIAKEWYDISKGKIVVKLYAGGIAGTEEAMLRKTQGLRSALQGAALTSLGLNGISPEVLTLSLPLLVRNDEEFLWIIKEMQDSFAKRFTEKGFILIGLIPVGWVNFFAKRPVFNPEDLMQQRLGVGTDAEFFESWKTAGFNVVPIDIISTGSALQNGKIDAFYAPPYVCASFSWFTLAKNMCSLKLAPILGGFIINSSTWKAIPDELKPELMKSAQKTLATLYEDTKLKELEAIKIMMQNGLVINQLKPEHEKKWNEFIMSGYDQAIGKIIPREFYELVKEKLENYRKKHGA